MSEELLIRKQSLFLVAPAYNEEESVPRFVDEVDRALKASKLDARYRAELVLVDDGSTDATYARLSALVEARPRGAARSMAVLKLSRNFGHQSALHAGLEYAFQKSARGDFFVVLDSDLQHPPRLIAEIVRHLEAGIHHAQMVRKDDPREGWFKRTSSGLFYRVFSFLGSVKLPRGGSDFRGFSHPFLEAYFKLPERERFNRGLFTWLGFSTLQIPYEPGAREAGVSKYSTVKMLKLGLTGITYFSSKPLLWTLAAITMLSVLFCGSYIAFEAVRYFHGHHYVLGWPTIVFFVCFWGGSLSFGQLLLGIYVSRIFEEVKGRPAYVIEETRNSVD
ncbi:MAG: glycosyltransferase family 2 protein [Deltaproteobacteria bacterium]|nr:glycosyltransferase family 2 protein [Deltaproteobacteria bacterium]